MKIYHTETQADYNALMVELEEQGYLWKSGKKPTEVSMRGSWSFCGKDTRITANLEKELEFGSVVYHKENYPDIPIIKYKAKQEGHSMTPEQERAYKRTQADKAERHKEIADELNAIYISKNHDYGDSFGETFKKLGIISAVTRISDKVNRLQSLAVKTAEERKVKDEGIKDTLYDLANYAIMSIIELEGEEE